MSGGRGRTAVGAISRARSAILFLAVSSVLLVGAPHEASAEPSVWARARDPVLARNAAAIADADALLYKDRDLLRMERAAGVLFHNKSSVEEARRILESAGAATSSDPMMRYRLAEVMNDLGEHEGASKHYEAALKSPSLAAPLRASGLTELAICYARQGRHEDEIKAYTDALALEPIGPLRAMILANRAEAYMVLGDIIKAIEGYRASLSALLAIEMPSFGTTTLWGLGVALDRSGDLESGLQSIEIARQYDPLDRLITGPGWFYVPEYDSAWYAALGHWAYARKASLSMDRMNGYVRSIAAWESYIERAPETDRWRALAKVRLRACQAERDAFAKREGIDLRGRRPAGSGRPGGSGENPQYLFRSAPPNP